MADLRDNQPEDRGHLKKVQTYIPGFRGYSQKEDLRDADRMLRMILSQKMLLARKNLEETIETLQQALIYEDIDLLTFDLNSVKRLESEIAYADSGLSWMASDTSTGGEEIERLYEYDIQLLDMATLILKQSEDVKQAASANNKHAIKSNAADMRTKLTMLEDTFRKRMLSLRRIG